jgi:Ca2+-binding EF-hand superfamily protein
MLKHSKLMIAFTMLSLVGAAGVAAARQGHRGPPAEMIAPFDTNKDGKLDDAERAAMHTAMQAKHAEHRKQVLAKFDANKDGKLDDTEREAMLDQMVTEHFQKLDANHDGSISLAELKAGARELHKRGGKHGMFMGEMGPPGEFGGPGMHGPGADQDD